jgi:hypothetical protein
MKVVARAKLPEEEADTQLTPQWYCRRAGHLAKAARLDDQLLARGAPRAPQSAWEHTHDATGLLAVAAGTAHPPRCTPDASGRLLGGG